MLPSLLPLNDGVGKGSRTETYPTRLQAPLSPSGMMLLYLLHTPERQAALEAKVQEHTTFKKCHHKRILNQPWAAVAESC